MSVLLAPVEYAVWRPSREKDAHGWAQAELVTLTGTVTGCIQEGAPTPDPMFMGNGLGQNAPEIRCDATAYLNSPVQPGDRIGIPGGVLWRVAATRHATDYTGAGLDCWLAFLTRMDGDV